MKNSTQKRKDDNRSNRKSNERLIFSKKFIKIILPVAAVIFSLFVFPKARELLYDIVFPDENPSSELAVHYIDIGQGDSELIVTPQGETVMIDCGPNYSEDVLIRYLKLNSVKTIDYLVLTHPHEDHIGGADKVINELEVKNVIMPDVTTTTSTFKKLLNAISENDTKLITAKTGDKYQLEESEFKILGPVTIDEDNLNNCSIVLRFRFKDTYFLFTGDAEAKAETEILDTFSDKELKSDVLKVGHHGSSTSTSEDFLKAVMPSAAVISCEKNNKFGHPHSETLEILEKYGIKCLRTDKLGSIVLYSDGKRIIYDD